MGYPITNSKDYSVGRFSLPVNNITIKDLIYTIEDTEEDALQCMLGVELSGLLIDDLDAITNIPTSVRFLSIWNKFAVEDDCGGKYTSKGIKDILKSLVFFYEGRSRSTVLTMNGVKQQSGENSENGVFSGTNLIKNYNSGVISYKAIQQFICDSEEYPEYKGSDKKFISII